MVKLENITKGTVLRGILPSGFVTVIDVTLIGDSAVNLTYKDNMGRLGSELLYRDREKSIEIVESGKPWTFEGESPLFRLVSEAQRIHWAHLFDPHLAVHTSLIEPLPHQITAVYDEMLPRQPLRFLLADDPGAGKTIMAGLLIKELMARGDVARCLIVCPGNLVNQWQDELSDKFNLPFEIMTNDNFESARTGNWFLENNLAICRLDKLSRNENVQEKLKETDWDIIICDEAHKMSASFFGGEVKYTKRHHLGQLLSSLTRHFLLLTATPHNGKEEDFQLFMSLLDGDRFEGKFRDGVHVSDCSDLMRRLVKEQLVKFDGRPLFPERIAYAVGYKLSDGEAKLYKAVTDYVREEFNRADFLDNDGRKGTVGFALTILQRRLASSPEAIYQSIRRRKERLEKRLREEELLKRGEKIHLGWDKDTPELTEDDLEDIDDAPDQEVEATEERIVDRATAAQTIAELKAEIKILAELEQLAWKLRQSGTDRKWDELSNLLQNQVEMFDAHRHRRKLIIFTENRDTLTYLYEQVTGLLGKPEAVVTIHGSMGREQRRNAEQNFTQNKDVEVLIATDAAGEGINLQRAHLMVNYDLPWNPNRLEQRFGRIHRIGQNEVCHCWNLIATETREGDVYHRLLHKLDQERKALGGQVFDVLGKMHFGNRRLRDLFIEAVRYGERPEVRNRLNEIIDEAMDHERLRELIEERALAKDSMDSTKVQAIREEMERTDARRLQPHFVEAFFIEAFTLLGGTLREREPRRYEITNVPAVIRNRDRMIGVRHPILLKYERVTFAKELISIPGKPLAEFICPGHPLLDTVIDVILERYRDLLRCGTVLIDENDAGTDIRLLVYLEHSIHDAKINRDGSRRLVSRQFQFLEMDSTGKIQNAGHAPYLDYRPATKEEKKLVINSEQANWISDENQTEAFNYAALHLVPKHLESVRAQKEALVDKTLKEVTRRLTAEINYWDHRAAQLREQELAGRINARLNSDKARQRADELTGRLEKRTEELALERQVAPQSPNLLGAAIIVPDGLLKQLQGQPAPTTVSRDTDEVERIAMNAIMDIERRLGFEPIDVSAAKCGYDIESRIPHSPGKLRFIEVKGRANGADTVTITKNEILTGLNKPDDFILAIVLVDGQNCTPYYIRKPFNTEPDFGVTSVNYKLKELIDKADKVC